jgi:cytochrome c553
MRLTGLSPWAAPLLALLVTLSPCHLVTLSSARAAPLEYNRDVRPILAEHCFACHGPDSAARKADLRLDRRDDALKAGVIVPGHPEQSPLVERIFTDEPAQLMPPRKSGKKLTAAEKETLRNWVLNGAGYQAHWSFLAPVRPALPAVKETNWVRNPIDRFILARLEKEGLKPAPEADRRTLARRVSLDLIGLPPTPAEVEAFVNDSAPNAYERFVDRLLQSLHWGEHRGRYWLDAARYADTHGIHFDNYRENWVYRDWVFNAFNANKPFDRFTIEQLAGDLLPGRTLDQQVASGFNRCNITTNEGGAIAEEYLVLYARDRTETVSQVWLGLTAGCAVCHDHKFDPLSQREFYSLTALFNNTTQGAMDGNVKDTPPVLPVPQPADRPRWQALQNELAEANKQVEARKQTARADFEKWLAGAARPAEVPAAGPQVGAPSSEAIAATTPSEGLRLHAPLTDGEGTTVRVTLDGQSRNLPLVAGAGWEAGHVGARAFKSRPGVGVEIAEAGDFDRDQGFSYGAWVKVTNNAPFGALLARMGNGPEYRGWDLWVQNGRVGSHLVHRWPDDALKVVTKKPVKLGEWHHLFATYDGSGRASGLKIYVDGVPQETMAEADRLKSSIRTPVPFKVGQRHRDSGIDGLLVQDLRLYGRALTGPEVERLVRGSRAAWLAAKPAAGRSAAEKDELFAWWLTARDAVYQGLVKKLDGLRQEETAIKSRMTVAHVMQERPGEPMAYVLYRGEYDKRRDPVKPDTPRALPALPPDLPRNRLGFAQWLLRPEHPLTARVTVNRFWQEVFGTGLVRTSGDFGVSGELPSHPELLDWLAVEFRESGWDVKRFFRLLVTSAAYRQASVTTREKLEKDPQNRLLSRGPRFRMDAEMVRDYALAASGLLVGKVGGPSVKPYQPDGVWEAVAMIGSNTRDYRRDSGEGLYRRSVYTFWKRSAPPASMDIFNAPSRETCTVRRERTNTPLQALVTLNDPQFIEAARHLAETVLKNGGIDGLARRLLSRPLRPEEMQVVKASLDELLAHYKAHPDDARKLIAVGESKADPALEPTTLAAWTMLANQLMNLDEVLNK